MAGDSNDNDNDTQGGIGATAYYGGVAVALLVLILAVTASRLIYRRRIRRRLLQANRQERLNQQERGEAPGLPTYGESRSGATQPYISTDYPPPSGPPPAIHSNRDNHFHFHFPNLSNLPQALHLRPRGNDGNNDAYDAELPTQPPPAYEPPKFRPPQGPPPSRTQPQDSSQTDNQTDAQQTTEVESRHRQSQTDVTTEQRQGRGGTPPPPPTARNSQDGTTAPADQPYSTGEYSAEDDFIHPEERRRREAAGSP